MLSCVKLFGNLHDSCHGRGFSKPQVGFYQHSQTTTTVGVPSVESSHHRVSRGFLTVSSRRTRITVVGYDQDTAIGHVYHNYEYSIQTNLPP